MDEEMGDEGKEISKYLSGDTKTASDCLTDCHTWFHVSSWFLCVNDSFTRQSYSNTLVDLSIFQGSSVFLHKHNQNQNHMNTKLIILECFQKSAQSFRKSNTSTPVSGLVLFVLPS